MLARTFVFALFLLCSHTSVWAQEHGGAPLEGPTVVTATVSVELDKDFNVKRQGIRFHHKVPPGAKCRWVVIWYNDKGKVVGTSQGTATSDSEGKVTVEFPLDEYRAKSKAGARRVQFLLICTGADGSITELGSGEYELDVENGELVGKHGKGSSK